MIKHITDVAIILAGILMLLISYVYSTMLTGRGIAKADAHSKELSNTISVELHPIGLVEIIKLSI